MQLTQGNPRYLNYQTISSSRKCDVEGFRTRIYVGYVSRPASRRGTRERSSIAQRTRKRARFVCARERKIEEETRRTSARIKDQIHHRQTLRKRLREERGQSLNRRRERKNKQRQNREHKQAQPRRRRRVTTPPIIALCSRLQTNTAARKLEHSLCI